MTGRWPCADILPPDVEPDLDGGRVDCVCAPCDCELECDRVRRCVLPSISVPAFVFVVDIVPVPAARVLYRLPSSLLPALALPYPLSAAVVGVVVEVVSLLYDRYTFSLDLVNGGVYPLDDELPNPIALPSAILVGVAVVEEAAAVIGS